MKIYPEVLQLTPTYSVERMVLAHYRRVCRFVAAEEKNERISCVTLTVSLFTFLHTQIDETHLQILVKRFPALRWLRISHCYGLYKREIDKLKRMLPDLAVAFDEVKSDRI